MQTKTFEIQNSTSTSEHLECSVFWNWGSFKQMLIIIALNIKRNHWLCKHSRMARPMHRKPTTLTPPQRSSKPFPFTPTYYSPNFSWCCSNKIRRTDVSMEYSFCLSSQLYIYRNPKPRGGTLLCKTDTSAIRSNRQSEKFGLWPLSLRHICMQNGWVSSSYCFRCAWK